MLFEGSIDLQDAVVTAVTTAPAALAPIDVVGAAMERAAAILEGNHDYARRRAAVIAANPGLHERELLKFAALAGAIAAAVRDRGVSALAASLAAETGVTVFKLGFEAWIGDEGPADLVQCIRTALDELKALTARG